MKRASGRPKRTPISGRRNVLTLRGAEQDKFHYRIVNDTGDRVKQLQDIGYEIVTDPTVQVGERRVANPTQEGAPIKVSVGGGVQAYVMRIPKEYFNEDQKQKNDYVDELERGIKREAEKAADYGKLEIKINK